MIRSRSISLSLVFAVLAAAGCSTSGSTDRSEDPLADEEKDDSIAASKVSPKLAPLVAFLRDDKNLTAQLGPEDTTAEMVRKRVKVVSYKEFGRAVDSATRAIARNYFVGSTPDRRGFGLIDALSVGDMYVSVKAGYGEDSFIDKLIVEPKRAEARRLASALLPEAALVSLDHASTVSTGNYILVLGDLTSEQAIVMTVEYEIY